MELEGAVVLITGASSGIGLSVARACAAGGARLVLSGRDQVALQRIAGTCDAAAVPADLSDPGTTASGPDGLAARAEAVHGHIDILILSAGLGLAGPHQQAPAPAIREVVEVNLLAPLLLVRSLLPQMLHRGRGHIVLIGSIAGLTGVADEAAYSATKAAISTFADALRLECHGTGIAVSTVVPGVVRTPFFERRGVPYRRRFPRPVPPERVAAAVLDVIRTGDRQRIVPRWLGVAPRVRALAPGTYAALAGRFGRQDVS